MICVWVSWPWVSLTTHWSEAVTWVRSISISFWKSKTPFEMSSAIINFGNQRLPEKSIWNAKTKKYFFFLIKDKLSKSKKTRQDKNQNKWILWVILSNTVDINLGRRYLLKNIVNPSWAIRLGMGLARQGGITGNSGCREGVPGVFQEPRFRDVSDPFRVFPRDFNLYFQIPVQLVKGKTRK